MDRFEAIRQKVQEVSEKAQLLYGVDLSQLKVGTRVV